MYHRVTRTEIDPWELAVAPENFAGHMAYLKRHRTPLTMSEFVRRHVKGGLPDDAVGVTFDDGYLDNLINAKPQLDAESVPATLFVVTGRLAEAQPFWWDELAALILGHRGGMGDAVRITDAQVALRWPPDERLSDEHYWRAWDRPRTPREAAYIDIWTRLRAVSRLERSQVMASLRERLGPVDCGDNLPMTAAELMSFRTGGRIELGGHSVSHPALTTLAADECREEIDGSRDDLARLIGTPAAGFAYPYGDMNAAVRADVARSGFAWACSTVAGFVGASSDLFALPRLAIGDWSVDRLAKSLAAA